MGDGILLGVLRMPPECWNDQSALDYTQRHARYVEAADYIEALKRSRQIDANEHISRVNGMLALLRTAEEALASCYDVVEWPAENGSKQLDALRQIRAALNEDSQRIEGE